MDGKEPVYSKTTRDGRRVEFFIKETFGGITYISACLEGKELERTAPHHAPKNDHGFKYAVGRFLLTDYEYEILRTALKNYSSPATERASLEYRREKLILDYTGLIQDQGREFERLHDVQDARAWDVKLSYESKIAAALEALRAFDRTHPEIKPVKPAPKIWD